MSAAQKAVVNEPLIYKGEDQKLTYDDVNDILDKIGFNIVIRKNSVDYPIIKELVNEGQFYKNQFDNVGNNKLELYKKCEETIKKLELAVSKYKDKQKANDSIIGILDDIQNYLEIHKNDNKQNESIINFITNLRKDLISKDLNYVIHKNYSSSIVSLLENTYDEARIKTLIKTKEINNVYTLLNNNRLKHNDIIIISENDNFDVYKLLLLLNIQQNQKKYLLNFLNLQTNREEQIQITESNNYLCVIDDSNKIRGIKIGEYKK